MSAAVSAQENLAHSPAVAGADRGLGGTGNPSIDTIKRLCVAVFMVSLVDLESPRRDQASVHARWAAIWLARRHTAHSLSAIGRHIGGRDHTTILHALRRFDAMLDADGDLARRVASISDALIGIEGRAAA